MVPSLARQAVIIKCGNDTSVLTGNYELGYALGLLVQISGILFPGDYRDMKDLQTRVLALIENRDFDDIHVKRLVRMVSLYMPSDEMDRQMGEMINMGLGEKNHWKLHENPT